jgi:hypothetical protein
MKISKNIKPLITLAAVWIVLGGSGVFGQNQEPDVRELKIGEVVELKGGETHVYGIELKAGQVFRLDIQEKGIEGI